MIGMLLSENYWRLKVLIHLIPGPYTQVEGTEASPQEEAN